MKLFLTFNELAERCKDRPLALYGLGSIADATRRRCGLKIDWLVDIEVGLAGTKQNGVSVLDGADIEKLRPRPFVVICCSDILEAVAQLKRAGFIPQVDFAVSPLLKDQLPIVRLLNAKGSLLLSSGALGRKNANGGGGLYELRFDRFRTKLFKLRTGPVYGLIRFGQHFLGIDPRKGIIQFDAAYQEKLLAPLPLTAWCHGIAFDSSSQTFWVTATQLDQVMVFDSNFRLVDTVSISDRCNRTGEWGHHPNDILIYGESVFVSMFSRSGLWKAGVIDGAVVEIDLRTHAVRGTVVSALHMPHNPVILNDKLVVADSFRGNVVRADGQIVASFPGYARGLATDDRYVYVGQSLNRAYRQVPRGGRLTEVDTKINILDLGTGVSRSLALTPDLTDIHTILPLNTKPKD